MQHIILFSTSTCLGVKIKNLKTVEEMWAEVTVDATMKSTLFILDVEDQLSSMNLKTHLSELKQHFQLLMQCHKNILKMGSVISDTWFNMMIMLSLPESYRPTVTTSSDYAITNSRSKSCRVRSYSELKRMPTIVGIVL